MLCTPKLNALPQICKRKVATLKMQNHDTFAAVANAKGVHLLLSVRACHRSSAQHCFRMSSKLVSEVTGGWASRNRSTKAAAVSLATFCRMWQKLSAQSGHMMAEQPCITASLGLPHWSSEMALRRQTAAKQWYRESRCPKSQGGSDVLQHQ